MCCASSEDNLADLSNLPSFEEIQSIVESEFDVTESYIQHGIPTFHVTYQRDSKEAFLKLMKQLDGMKLLPILRQNSGITVLQILAKPPLQPNRNIIHIQICTLENIPIITPNRNIINIALFFATLGTVFFSGYLQAADVLGALLFTAAIMAILGSHEMGHKLLADKHDVDATYPYFIPGFPPIGTFGALIRQKALPPNKDALFDIGFTGPITGFVVSVIVTIIGVQLSTLVPLEPDVSLIPVPLMFQLVGWNDRYYAEPCSFRNV